MTRQPPRLRCGIGAVRRRIPAAVAQPAPPLLPILRTVHAAVGHCDCAWRERGLWWAFGVPRLRRRVAARHRSRRMSGVPGPFPRHARFCTI